MTPRAHVREHDSVDGAAAGALDTAHDWPRPIERGPGEQRLVALTFDACQTRRPYGYDYLLVKVLRDSQVKATLFLCGSWIHHHREVTRSLAQDTLFELANHTYYHPTLTGLRPDSIRLEIKATQDTMYAVTGRRGAFMRPPAGKWDSTVVAIAESLGLATVLWDVSSGDPDPNVTAERMVEWVVSQVKPGSIVLFHMNTRGWHTAEAMPEIVTRLRRRGLRLVTLSEMMARTTN